MSIEDGNPVNAEYTNSQLVCTEGANCLTGILKLAADNAVSGADIEDLQKTINNILFSLNASTNDGLNIGGGNEVFEIKDGFIFRFRTIKALSGINITTNGDCIEIQGDFSTLVNLSDNQTIAGEKTFSDDAIFSGDICVDGDLIIKGDTTTLNTTELVVEDALATYNSGGTDVTANGAGIEIERPSGNACFNFNDSLDSKFELGIAPDKKEVMVVCKDTFANLSAITTYDTSTLYVATDTNLRYVFDGTSLVPVNSPALGADSVLITDVKPVTTDGGSFVPGDWRTRDLNTIEHSPGANIATVTANQVTILSPGTYFIRAQAPAYFVSRSKTRWMDITNTSVEVVGISEFSSNSQVAITVNLAGYFTTTAANVVFELQHRCQVIRNGDGMGASSDFPLTDEIYSQVFITRLA